MYDESKILYVRGYTKNAENPSLSGAYGVDQDGNPAFVRLRPMDQIKDKHKSNAKVVIPDIDTLARSDPRKAGCRPGDGNHPNNRTGGIIVFENISPDKTGNELNLPGYTATWPRVLSHNASEPEPIYGRPGYVERAPYFTTEQGKSAAKARYLQTEMQRQKGVLFDLYRAGDKDAALAQQDHLRRLMIEFDELVRHRHRAVVMCPDGDGKHPLVYRISTLERLERKLTAIIHDHSINGAHGGVMIRALNEHGEILTGASGQIHTRWDPMLSRPNSPRGAVTDPADEVRRYLASPRGASLFNLHREKGTVQLIPTERYNFGSASNNKYARPEESDRIYGLFKNPHDHSNAARYLALRTVHPSGDMDNLLVSEVFHTSRSLGTPLQVGPQGTHYSYSTDSQPVAARGRPTLTEGREYVVEMPDGLRATAECKKGSNGLALYSGRQRIDEYTMVGPAPSRSPSL